MTRPAATIVELVALVALGLTVLGVVGGLVFVALRVSAGALPPAQVGGVLFPPLVAVPFAVVGTLVVLRRSRNAIGRLMVLAGTMMGLAYPADAYAQLDLAEVASLPGADAAAWFFSTIWITAITIVIPRMVLLFPDGRPPSPRWRVIDVIQILLGTAIALVAISPGPLPDYPSYQNPFGVAGLADAGALLEANTNVVFGMMFVVLVAACLSLVARFRRSTGVERKQLEWIAWIVLMVALGEIMGLLVGPWWSDVGVVITGVGIVALVAMPIAIGVAVLRYRLWEIDRIISRTIGWGIVTGILVAVFIGGVIGLEALLAGITQGETLAVAVSTLVAFALFAPLRRRVQAVVDRRFDRARYDGQRTVATFAEQLRDKVASADIDRDIRHVIERTVRPAHLGVWLRSAVAPVEPDETRAAIAGRRNA